MPLTTRFEQALQYATVIHAHQLRKGTTIPYVAHLLAVTSIVLEYGGDEDQAIGALLHDAGEDAGGQGRIDDIRLRFGDAVADIVLGCTDTLATPKPPWHERKKAYIAHLPHASLAVRMVSAADKLAKARAMAQDYRVHGELLWERFSASRADTLWYYAALAQQFVACGDHPVLAAEFQRTVATIQTLVDQRDANQR